VLVGCRDGVGFFAEKDYGIGVGWIGRKLLAGGLANPVRDVGLRVGEGGQRKQNTEKRKNNHMMR
jgi:hypothetical protein